jgi:hypothetical protein
MVNGNAIHSSWLDTGIYDPDEISYWGFGYEEEVIKYCAMQNKE